MDAQILNGTVTIYSFKSGLKGEVLGMGITDDKGLYQMTISAPDQAILIEVKNGAYTEESSDTTVDLQDGQVLRALTFYKSGVPLETMITPFTNLAAGLAEYQVKQGQPIENALIQASTAISTLIGIDILSTTPLNITNPKNLSPTISDELIYGFWTASLSAWTEEASIQNGSVPHKTWTSIAFAQVMYRDINDDGLLDGKGIDPKDSTSVDLGFGLVNLNANTYRTQLAQKMMSMVGSAQNKTGIRFEHILPQAQQLSTSTHALFGALPPVPLDIEGPLITPTEAEGLYHNLDFDFKVELTDAVGIQSVGFDLDGQDLGQTTDIENAFITINTTLYTDGEHEVGVRALDNLGNESYQIFKVKFLNGGSSLNVLSPTWVNTSPVTLFGDYIDNGVGVQSIVVNGIVAILNNEQRTWQVEIPLEDETDSVSFTKEVSFVITDGLGVKINELIPVNMDTLAPSFDPEVQYSDATFFNRGSTTRKPLSFAKKSERPIRVMTNNVSLNGTPIEEESLDQREIPWIGLYVKDQKINGVFSAEDEITAEIQYSLSETVKTPWHTLVAVTTGDTGYRFVIPLASEVLHEEWHKATQDEAHLIQVRIKDKAGNRTDYNFRFKVEFISPPMIISSQQLKPFDLPFEQRMTLAGQEIPLVEYTISNPTSKSVLFSFETTSAHTVLKTHGWDVRKHTIQLIEETQWQAQARFRWFLDSCYLRPGSIDWIGQCDLAKDSKTLFENKDAPWQDINFLWVWFISFEVEFRTALTRITPKDPSILQSQTIFSDIFPPVPQGVLSENSMRWKGFDPATFPQFRISQEVANKPYNYFLSSGLVKNNNPGYRTMAREPFASYQGKGRYLRQRSVPKWVSSTGPRTEFGSAQVTENFSTGDNRVKDDTSRDKIEVGGWYSLPPGETATIITLATLPTLNYYNEPFLRDTKGDDRYTLRTYDIELKWSVNETINFKVVHDTGFKKASKMTPKIMSTTSRFSATQTP